MKLERQATSAISLFTEFSIYSVLIHLAPFPSSRPAIPTQINLISCFDDNFSSF